MIRDQ